MTLEKCLKRVETLSQGDTPKAITSHTLKLMSMFVSSTSDIQVLSTPYFISTNHTRITS